MAFASTAYSIRANDFASQWRDIGEDALCAVDRVGNSGRLILGEEVRSFERALADWWGVAHAVGVASGMDALEIALRCAELEPGAAVLTTPLSAFATTLAILRAGARPVWCDVDESGALDLEQAEAVLRSDSSIRAMVTVHLYGHPQDPCELERMRDEYGVAVIEDCAQAAGAERDGRSTGLVGLAAGTSLYPTKNIGALGDGGVLLTMDSSVAERARCLRNYGQRARYEHSEPGLNSRLDELQAAILRSAVLPRLDRWLRRRREIAARYTEGLSGCALRPIASVAGRSAHHLFPVEVSGGETESVFEGLARMGVEVGRHYPFVCPDQRAVRGVGLVKGPLTVARRLAGAEISLPIHPYLHDEELDGVIEACLHVCAWNA